MSAALKETIARKIESRQKELSLWLGKQTSQAPPPFYCSVDLRDSGHKVVPVDCNLFPAGFNNICPEDLRSASSILRSQLVAAAKAAKRSEPRSILLIPEAHTQNPYYVENLFHLLKIITEAGFETRLGWIGTAGETPITLHSDSGKELQAWPIEVSGSVLSAGDFVPDLILLNNDFSSGHPMLLDPVAQPILPTHALGWHSRKKSDHFMHYNRLAEEFASIIELDPWHVRLQTEEIEPVHFNEGVGIDDTAQCVEKTLSLIERAYREHGIDQDPFVFVKSNRGTYGMGIMVARSPAEITQMNRRTKNKMSVGKNRMAIDSVIVQEGVPTATLVGRLPAEPVIYLMGAELVGGFLRTHSERGIEENLNAPGMVFKKLCMSDLRVSESQNQMPVLELVYGWIARLSALAAGREAQDIVRH